MKKVIASLTLTASLVLAGCATTSTTTTTPETFVENNGALIQAAASIATGAVLTFVDTKDPTAKTALANEIYSSANALNSLATGTIPTVAQVQNAIVSFNGNSADANYASYAQSLSALYGSYLNNLQGDPKAATMLLSDLALGAQQGASAYETVTTTTASTTNTP